ncbi:hypothetical protein A2732_00260 [Candidatus Nomurabacteria bacterium RIFCSPHIGHO2_01_FULL_40_10]|nr:MAG: hypothetical protein A2732_00260 [Candidatus Nomurabacteria bacterium RIFCSPHIGHO2_01_FULL_40_10]
MNKYTFHVSGTHCASCKILIEDILKEQDFVKNAQVDLKRETVKIETDTDINPEELAQLLTNKVKSNGYTLSVNKSVVRQDLTTAQNGVIWQALPIGLLFLALFFILQKSGILNIGIGGQITPIASFFIGLIASVSTCLAIVGGLVLSLSAKISQDNISDTKTFILFHAGRLVSFALLGGLLGALGGAIGINFTLTAILGLIASLVMLLLGLNLIGVFAKSKITLHPGIFNFFRKIEHKTLTPLIVGFGTFFLPCGFTQSMQVAALSSGSFFSGLLIMVAFALGTLPMLALLSFGSASFAHGRHASLFFKSAGVVVLGLGIFAFLAGLAGLRIINPLFSI